MQATSSNASSTHSQQPRTRRRVRILPIVLFSTIGVIAIIAGFLISSAITRKTPEVAEDASSTEIEKEAKVESSTPFINLQEVVDEWIAATNAEVGLMIYDLDNEQIAAEYNAEEVFGVASIYKLFFVYAGYQQIDAKEIDADEYFVTTYDYRADDYSLGECLDLMIRESYNGCADLMHDSPTWQRQAVQLIERLELEGTTELGLYSTAEDLIELLKLYWTHPDLSESSWQKISDSMLDQPATDISPGVVYDWRQGLPSGFSKAKVYDKVGWAWNGSSWDTYADVAFIELDDHHYAAVVLTSGIRDPDVTTFRQLGEKLEAAIQS